MTRKLFFICLLLGLANNFLLASVFSQIKFQVPTAEKGAFLASDGAQLKPVSLRAFCPTPGDQGSTGACNSWAAAYGALTISRAVRANIKGTEEVNKLRVSASFLHNQLTRDCRSSAEITEVLDFLKEKGSCLYATFDKDKSSCNQVPSERAKIEASKYKIRNYFKLFGEEEDEKTKKEEVLKALKARNPIIAGIKFPQAFHNISSSKIWEYAGDLSQRGTKGHSVVIIGYDTKLEYIEIMNSWGTGGWGEEGFARIAFSSFWRMLDFGYVIDQHPMEVSINSCKILSFNPKKLIDTSISCVFRDHQNYYETNWEWSIETQFQLQLIVNPKHGYLYILSFEPDEVIKCHRPATFENGSDHIMINPEITQKLIHVPHELGLLQLNKVGSEFLCFLFSPFPIKGLEEKRQQLTEAVGSVPNKLIHVFGEDMLPFSAIGYEFNECNFEVEDFNRIIPLILKISTPD